VTTLTANLYLALGYPYGPILVSVAVALFTAVQVARRRSVLAWAAAGYVAYLLAATLDGRAEHAPDAVHMALVAGWLAVVLAVAEVARISRANAERQAEAEEEERQRLRGERRPGLAQELHDVLARHISLIPRHAPRRSHG